MHGVDHWTGFAFDEQHFTNARAQEFFGVHVIEEARQTRIEARDVEQGAGLGVQSEMAPGPDFEQFFERADAAGQRDEAVRQLGHGRFAFMHRTDDAQVAQPAMRQLARDQRLRNHADHLGAACTRRIGDDAHESYRRPAVYEADVPRREFLAERDCRVAVGRVAAHVGAAEHAQPLHQPIP